MFRKPAFVVFLIVAMLVTACEGIESTPPATPETSAAAIGALTLAVAPEAVVVAPEALAVGVIAVGVVAQAEAAQQAAQACGEADSVWVVGPADPNTGVAEGRCISKAPMGRCAEHNMEHSPECDPAARSRVEKLQEKWATRGGETDAPQQKGDVRCVATIWDGSVIRYGIFVAKKFTEANVKGDVSFYSSEGWLTSYGDARWAKDVLEPSKDLKDLAQQQGVTVENRQVACSNIPGELPTPNQAVSAPTP